MRLFRHPFDGQEVRVVERRRGGGSHYRLNLHVELPDGTRMWLSATWTSLEARDPGALELLGELPDFIRLRILRDDLERRLEATDGQGTGTVADGVGARVERWLQVPPPDREAFVQELAGLMVRQANRSGTSGERVVADHEQAPWAVGRGLRAPVDAEPGPEEPGIARAPVRGRVRLSAKKRL